MKDFRLNPRIPMRTSINIRELFSSDGSLLTPSQPVQMEVFDISVTGAGVLSKVDLPLDSFLIFVIYLEQLPYEVMAVVRWKNTNQLYYRYGLEFMGPSNMMYRHLKALSSQNSFFDKPSSFGSLSDKKLESRNYSRFDFTTSILCFKYSINNQMNTECVPFLFHLKDLSYTGIGLTCDLKLEANSVLSFNLQHRDTLRTMDVEVMWSKYHINQHSYGRFITGARFKHSSSQDILFIHDILQSLKR